MLSTALENLAFFGPCDARSAAVIKHPVLRHASHRPECEAGASWVGLGEGAKPDAPLLTHGPTTPE